MVEVCQVGGHEILNQDGQVIRITRETLIKLDRRGFLERDLKTGLKKITQIGYLVFIEAENQQPYYRELGPDCSGPNVVKCTCDDCRGLIDVDESRRSSLTAAKLAGQA